MLQTLAARALRQLKRVEASVPQLGTRRRALTVAALKLEEAMPIRPLTRLRSLVLAQPQRSIDFLDPLHSAFGHLDDAQWRSVLLRSITEPVIDGVRLPAFPSPETQTLFTSHSNEAAIGEAFSFFQVAKAAMAQAGRPLGASTRLLDFGVGWGRIIRTFAKDVSAANLHGVDVNAPILETCRQLMPVGEYRHTPHGSPLPYAEGAFDLVTAFSVFSHLSEATHLVWLTELHRVLSPGGLVVLTTLSKRYIADCYAATAGARELPIERERAELVTLAFPRWREQLRSFDPAGYFYLPAGGGLDGLEPQHYGWTVVQPEYARAHWSHLFEIVEFKDDPGIFDQAYFVLRKRTASPPG